MDNVRVSVLSSLRILICHNVLPPGFCPPTFAGGNLSLYGILSCFGKDMADIGISFFHIWEMISPGGIFSSSVGYLPALFRKVMQFFPCCYEMRISVVRSSFFQLQIFDPLIVYKLVIGEKTKF